MATARGGFSGGTIDPMRARFDEPRGVPPGGRPLLVVAVQYRLRQRLDDHDARFPGRSGRNG